MDMNVEKRINGILNKIWLSFNSIIKNKSIMLLLILFPCLSMIVPLIFVPFWGCGGFLIQINTLLTTGLIYGTIIFGYKKSTLNKNEKLINKSRTTSYLSAFFVIMVFVFISSAIQLILLVILNNLNFLMINWMKFSNPDGGRVYDLSELRLFAWYWAIFWTMTIEFGIFFALRRIIKDEKVHYILLLSLIILSFIWGGTLNDYWCSYTYVPGTDIVEKALLQQHHSLFPRELYWPTIIFFPFYAPGQTATMLGDFTRQLGNGTGQDFFDAHQNYNHMFIHLSFNSNYEFKSQWNAIILAPIIWTTFLCIIGSIFKSEK